MNVSLPQADMSLHPTPQQQRTLAAGQRLQTDFRDGLQKTPAAGQEAEADVETSEETEKQQELRETFYSFVGQTFFGQLLSTMRKTTGKTAYLHGGRGEEVFQTQMDQILVERMSETTADSFAKPMYDLFTLRRD